MIAITISITTFKVIFIGSQIKFVRQEPFFDIIEFGFCQRRCTRPWDGVKADRLKKYFILNATRLMSSRFWLIIKNNAL